MFYNKSNFKRQILRRKQIFSPVIFSLLVFLTPFPGYAEERSQSNPPSSPDTGSPEEDFSAGGTRDNHLLTQVCGENGQQIAYLLGNNNREFTLAAYPTFWFYIPNNVNKVAQIKFVLTELETGNKVYNRIVEIPQKAGTVGITIPPEKKYALAPNINYSWSLEVDCVESSGEPVMALEGWLNRLPLNPDLESQLASVSQEEKYRVYLENDLLYDALNDLAQRRMKDSHNSPLETAWNRLLAELGWQDLAQQSAVKPYVLNANTTLCRN
ncbi:conserved hypothetical protein [Hyella patelloides LEGE 07179]|uniref:DUF928 domain-containing protein n=1 Tax=Hyella patelloides LEGE 07179 TaxID=945734 RepID=A0A563VVP1_9CYAN|nr:DUF928 domain-containing protein [Hyella patelloides]VEP15470.1 conserved hypothetical protein [Hyella patelloides LEGE 07179]